MKKILLISTGCIALLVIYISCDKNQNSAKSNEIQLQSPDQKMKLANSTDELVSKINQIVGFNEAVKISEINFPKTPAGYYSTVTYLKKEGTSSNIVFSNFFIASVSNHLVIHSAGNANRSIQPDYVEPSCYEYWCTTAGSCGTCAVIVTDPYGDPTISCTCAECHLHQKKEDCPPE